MQRIYSNSDRALTDDSISSLISNIISAWRDCKSLDADIILLIREEMESSVKAEYAEFEYILLQRYSCCNKLQTMFRLRPVLKYFYAEKNCKSVRM